MLHTAPDNIRVADLNKDGKPDLGTGFSAAVTSFTIRENAATTGIIDASSLLSEINKCTTSSNPIDLIFADFNGDRRLDVVTANQGANQLEIFSNISTGGTISTGDFVSDGTLATTSPNNLAVGDIDGDGKCDSFIES